MNRKIGLFGYDWDAIAGLLAAGIAIILHLLHVVHEEVVVSILLALLGLLFVNFMRHTHHNEATAGQVDRIEQAVERVSSKLDSPEVLLVGPRSLRTVHDRFLRDMKGDTVWYNVCLSMYVPPALFDLLLRPALDNPDVQSIQFVLDESQREAWTLHVQPRIAKSAGVAKVREPRWRRLDRNVSFILADQRTSGRGEALLSFWGEPFMAQSASEGVPRYILHVQSRSELLAHLVELQRRG